MHSSTRQGRNILGSLRLLHRNRLWFVADTSIPDKFAYYPALAAAYLRMPFGTKQVRYLGRRFAFDNPAAPLNLQTYPNEVTRAILANLDQPPRSVLDVGGNIGQFSATLSSFVDLEHLDVFEPNGSIVPMLRANLAHLGDRVHIYNSGLSDTADESGLLYFEPGRSAIGSVYRENAGDSDALQAVPTTFVSDPSSLTGRTDYDLVKVDVEGFEIEVIRALSGITARHLYIEVSSAGRRRSYADSELFAEITKSLGTFSLVYSSGSSSESATYELLLKFSSSPG